MFSDDLMIAMQVKRLRMRQLDLTNRKVLEANLVWMFHTIKASEQLLRVGCQVARDPMLQDFYGKKLDEEEGHVDWLQHDLITAGVKHDVIPRESMLMAGVQYYMLYHISPASLLGYIAALECFPTAVGTIEWLERTHGKELLRTSRYHAENDKAHGKNLLHFIDTRVAAEQPAILESAMAAYEFLAVAMMQMEPV